MTTGLDTLEATLALLAGRTAVAALTSTRLYGPPGLPDTYRGATQALLVIEDGGPADALTALFDTDVWLHCYGPSPASARALARTVRVALSGLGPLDVSVTGGTARLAHCWQTTGPIDVREPETGWFRCLLGFRMRWVDRVI